MCDLSGAIYPIVHVSVAADSLGNFFVTYGFERTSTWEYLHVHKYNDSDGWSAFATLQGTNGFRVSDAHLMVSSSGNAMVVWEKQDVMLSNIQILSSSYTPASGWSSEMQVRAFTSASPFYLISDLGEDGTAAVAWVESTIAGMALKCSRYAPSFEWTTIETLAPSQVTDIAGLAYGGGSGLLLYAQSVSPTLLMSRAFHGGVWQEAVQVASDPEIVNLQLAVNDQGQAMAVWSNSSYRAGVRYTTYSYGSGWAVAQTAFVFHNNWEYMGSNGLYLAENGHAFLVYDLAANYGSDTNGYFSRGFMPAIGWSAPSQITGPSTYSTDLMVSMSGNGFALPYWVMDVAVKTIAMAAMYVPSHLPGPLLIVATPTNGTASTSATLIVSGLTDPGARVSVGGREAVVDANGVFAISISLVSGSNVIEVRAEGIFGNSKVATRTVTYTDQTVQQLQNDVNNLKGQGTMYLALGLIALIVAVVAIVLLFMRRKA